MAGRQVGQCRQAEFRESVDPGSSLKRLEGPVGLTCAHRLFHRRSGQWGGGYSDQQIRSISRRDRRGAPTPPPSGSQPAFCELSIILDHGCDRYTERNSHRLHKLPRGCHLRLSSDLRSTQMGLG